MSRRMRIRFGILVLIGTLCFSSLGHAQAQGCGESVPPFHVPVQKTKIRIVGVEFQGEVALSDELRAELVEDIQQTELWVTPEEVDSSWVSQALNPIRDALRERGYFKTNVEGTAYLVRALAAERHYSLRVAIENGPKYRLGRLRFASVSDKPLLFKEALLRKQFDLEGGDVFDVTKIRHGLAAISRLYGSKGYIDATAEPETKINQEDSEIDLLINLDEQRPYVIARIEFLGLEPAAQKSLGKVQKVGEVFNTALWRSFFAEDNSQLPRNASAEKNMRVHRSVEDGTVDITLDFRPCPNTQLSDNWFRRADPR